MPALCFTSMKCITFPSPNHVKSELLVASYLLSLALHKIFTINVLDFKVDINSFMFGMCEPRCLNIENQTKLCQNPFKFVQSFIYFTCANAYFVCINLQSKCNLSVFI